MSKLTSMRDIVAGRKARGSERKDKDTERNGKEKIFSKIKQQELLGKAREFIENPGNLGKIFLAVFILPLIIVLTASIISSAFIFFSTPLGQVIAVMVTVILFFIMRKKGIIRF